jgi:hypothetical protein
LKKLALASGLFVALLGSHAHAAVPAGYLGTPFGGTPRPLPGRIELEDFDEGGQGVAWSVDDHTGNFGEGGCAANAYREGIHPQLCKTNTNPNELDVYSTGPMMGQKYPSDAMPQSIYIGYTHAVDWVKVTVNVAVAGTYKVSSTWASEPGGADGIKVQLSFNDVLKADAKLPGTGGYHNWVVAPDFATFELEAGVQVLQFAAKSMHLNYDYLQFSRVLPGGGVDTGGGPGGGGGSGAGGSASGGSATAGGAGTAGATAAGTGGAPGSGSGGASAGTTATDPLPTAGTATAGSTATTAGTAPTSAGTSNGSSQGTGDAEQDSSCSVALGRNHSSVALLGALSLLGLLAARRLTRL